MTDQAPYEHHFAVNKPNKLHKGKMQDCPICKKEEIGIDECFRRIAKKNGSDNVERPEGQVPSA